MCGPAVLCATKHAYRMAWSFAGGLCERECAMLQGVLGKAVELRLACGFMCIHILVYGGTPAGLCMGCFRTVGIHGVSMFLHANWCMAAAGSGCINFHPPPYLFICFSSPTTDEGGHLGLGVCK